MAMKQLKKSRKLSSGGFTLVELIVAMTITLILIGAAGAILISSTNLFAHQANKVEREAISDTAAEFIRGRLIFAQSVDIVTTLPASAELTNKSVLYIGDAGGNAAEKGHLYYKRAEDISSPINIYGEGFYKQSTLGLDYAVTVSPEGLKTFSITINIYNAGSDAIQYSITKTYKFVNSDSEDNTIIAGGKQSSVEPFYLIIE